MSRSADVYTAITQKIISELEKGVLPWREPWNNGTAAGLPRRWNDEPYSGINIITLWSEAAEKNYTSNYWMTFKQATDMKAFVRKGERAVHVVYSSTMVVEHKDDNGDTEKKNIPFLKSYPVFNACQIEGLPPAYYTLPPKPENNNERIAEIDKFFAATKAEIREGFKACYHGTKDYIEMPPLENFVDTASYYAILAHEITHWTKHPTRLDRDFGKKKWGDEGYAKEELVAELGSWFLAADLGLEPETRGEHVAYIQSWLEALKNDKRFIVTAASHAQKAVDYIHGLQAG